jgi:hypothetical protein
MGACLKISPKLKPQLSGFTLTEIAIVLGISGLVLGAVWTASSNVNNGNNAQVVETTLLNSLASYRSMYGANTVTGTDWASITCVGVNAGAYPKNTIAKGPCTDSDWGTYPLALGERSGLLYAFSVPSQQAIGLGAMQISKALCVQLASHLTQYPDAIWYGINSSSAAAFGAITLTTLTAGALCNAADGSNSVYVAFKK